MNPMAWALPSVGFTPPVTGTGPPNRVPPEKKVTDPVGAFPPLAVFTYATIVVPVLSLPVTWTAVFVVAWVMVTEEALDALWLKQASPP